MYNREHVTMYLLSPELVVGCPCCPDKPRLQELYKLFPFFPSRCNNVIPVVRVGRAGRGTGNDTGSGTFEAQYETKDTCFGCKSRGNGWLGSLYDVPTFSCRFLVPETHSSRRRQSIVSSIRVLTRNTVRKEKFALT